MNNLRLMTPEELKNSKNPAAGKTSDKLKTPQEYGIPFIKDMYRKLRKDFFIYMAENYPEDVEITFSNSDDYLGRFICTRKESRDPQGHLVAFDFEDPRIDFSNNFRLTPYELANVLAHEMIHLEQVSRLASEDGADELEYYQNDLESAFGHDDFFEMEAENLNKDYHLGVTEVCDDPTMKDTVLPKRHIDPKYFVAKTIGPNETSLISFPSRMLDDFCDKHKSEIGSTYRIFMCTDEAVNEKYGHPDEKTGRKTTIPTTMFNQYIASGVLGDVTSVMKTIGQKLDEYRGTPSNVANLDDARKMSEGTGKSYLVLIIDDVDSGAGTVYGMPHDAVPEFVFEHQHELLQERLFAGYTTDPYLADKYGCGENTEITNTKVDSREMKALLDNSEFVDSSCNITDQLLAAMDKYMEEEGGYNPKVVVTNGQGKTLAFVIQNDVERIAKEIAGVVDANVAVYDIADTTAVKLSDGEIDPGVISRFVTDGKLVPMYTVTPNGMKVQ